ncbi:hypothetical protein BASA61_008625 [Batrachochytrium salamandrivorans]|nr:hypothetical protein BASA61_008625 [Batrachochytrium salamandrivorans]KAH9250734.1 hypothetical protein BASA81_011450 [Batrachochytrium salamandrivorans]
MSDQPYERKNIHGTNPQFLIEKILRERIYECAYWKEKLFGASAETLVDRAVELQSIGGQFGSQKPTDFICLVLKMLQLQPDDQIITLFLNTKDFKYLTALAAFYIRLTDSHSRIYQRLEPLLEDRRKLRNRTNVGGYELTFMDQFISDLLTEDRMCDTILPRLTKRYMLEDQGDLELRTSILDGELDDMADGEESSKKSPMYTPEDSSMAPQSIPAPLTSASKIPTQTEPPRHPSSQSYDRSRTRRRSTDRSHSKSRSRSRDRRRTYSRDLSRSPRRRDLSRSPRRRDLSRSPRRRDRSRSPRRRDRSRSPRRRDLSRSPRRRDLSRSPRRRDLSRSPRRRDLSRSPRRRDLSGNQESKTTADTAPILNSQTVTDEATQKKKGWSKKKVDSLFKNSSSKNEPHSSVRQVKRTGAENSESLSVDEANSIRASLGLKPLQN